MSDHTSDILQPGTAAPEFRLNATPDQLVSLGSPTSVARRAAVPKWISAGMWSARWKARLSRRSLSDAKKNWKA